VAIILSEWGEFESPLVEGLWLTTAETARITGWTAKPEGMCRGDACVLLPAGTMRDGRIDVEAFWRLLGNPVVSDESRSVWVLSTGAQARSAALAGLKAPDFTLPDLAARPHRLSDLRGRKVLLTTWASWCGCRFDLVPWQALYDELKDRNFMIVAVAQETRGAGHARPWIEQANASYWCLIDTEHRLSELYGMVNVPQCVWIDEHGLIVRPTEVTGSTDYFRRMDRKARAMAEGDKAARDAAQQHYLAAVRDWVLTGHHALDSDAARRRLPAITEEIALAHAHFRLGAWLARHGRGAEAERHFAEASRLHPDSWNMWRQAADLQEVGRASSPEFWARVDALGERPYYAPPDIAGFPRQLAPRGGP
jgi:peroxiredoxin